MTGADVLLVIVATLGGSGGLLGAAAYLGQKLVEHRLSKDLKAYDAMVAADVRIKALQLPGYRQLWEISSPFRSSDVRDYEETPMRKAAEELRHWYYAGGNGVLLSFRAQTLLQAGLKLLSTGGPGDSAAIRKLFSRLRTQMKADLGFYTDVQAAAALEMDKVIAEARAEAASEPAAGAHDVRGAGRTSRTG